MNILEIKNLSISLKKSDLNIVNNISLKLEEGKTTAIVGESGSGKTITALSIIKLLPRELIIKSGEIYFNEKNLVKTDDSEMRNIRGKEIAFIFQEPLTALNPVVNIETQMTEILLAHNICSYEQAKKKSIEMLEIVGIPKEKIKLYPHNFSGGQRQRILIAMAMLTDPKLIIADEPTTSLDVITQMEILNLLEKIKYEKKLSLILITHNFSVVSNYSNYVYVMYLGEIMEYGKTDDIIENPKHPYTKALLQSIVKLEKTDRLISIEGTTPSIFNIPKGCRFITRCKYKNEKCIEPPPIRENNYGYYRCHNT